MQFDDATLRQSLQTLNDEEARLRSVLADLSGFQPWERREIKRVYTRSLAQIAVRQQMLRQMLTGG